MKAFIIDSNCIYKLVEKYSTRANLCQMAPPLSPDSHPYDAVSVKGHKDRQGDGAEGAGWIGGSRVQQGASGCSRVQQGAAGVVLSH